MNLRFSVLSLVAMAALVIAACGSAPPAPASDNGNPAAMPAATSTALPGEAGSEMQHDSGTAMPAGTGGAMGTDSGTSMPGDSGGEMQHDSGSAMPNDAGTPMPSNGSGAKDTGATVSLPAWFSTELTDVNTGQAFTIAGFQGKTVLVETMAIWCPNCLRQQKEVKALHEAAGMNEDFVTVVLDVDPNEHAGDLSAYSTRNGFDWTYAVAPRDVAREIGQLYGDQFLNPTSTPMLIVDRHGEAHPLPFGIKSASTLQQALAPFLDGGM
jgi:thiol-disulfide isomerase/thioredoxin